MTNASYQAVVKQFRHPRNAALQGTTNAIRKARRVVKKAVQQGRSERRGESYSLPYVEPLSDARTLLADFFNTLLGPAHALLRGSGLKLTFTLQGGS